jgi:prephenate dehydrogenase
VLFERVAIVGVGLIGGSLALAGRRADLIGEVVGVGRGPANLQDALDLGIADRVTSDVAAIGPVDLVVLAVPVRATPAVVRALAPGLAPGTVVTDVGSVKEWVVAQAQAALPPHAPFVGAHPIAGSERTGARAARADLFEDAVCVLTPVAATPAPARDAVASLWRGVGARVREMPPAEHDQALAWTSHLGHVLSYALSRSLGDAGGDLPSLGGPSLRELTRLAGGSAPMWRDIFLSNDRAVLAAVDGFAAALADLRQAIERGDDAALDALLELGSAARRRIERAS